MNTARTSRRYVLPLLLAMACVFTVNHASAQPDLRPLGENIADKGSAWYRFGSRTFDSQDGKRH